MFRFQWSKEVLNYLKDNQGLINDLELAFAEYRAEGTQIPTQGVLDMIAPMQYIWGIHNHIVLLRLVLEDAQWKIRIEVVKPTRSPYDEIFLG
ncbi:MAG: hypothetical protein R3C14_28990 [Caldilineaceae bacterium]